VLKLIFFSSVKIFRLFIFLSAPSIRHTLAALRVKREERLFQRAL
jgi:hypothetical protein